MTVDPMVSSSSSSSSSSSNTPPVNGRVLYLHFACRANLPIGSMLRVTGSSLWSPSTSPDDDTSTSTPTADNPNTADDPSSSSSHVLHQQQHPGAYEDTTGGDGRGTTTMGNMLHVSSVEMVTSPEMYPLWRTRTPVVIVAPGGASATTNATITAAAASNTGQGASSSSASSSLPAAPPTGVLRHRYRYMVVTPGGGADSDGFNSTTTARHDNEDDVHEVSSGASSSSFSGTNSLSSSPDVDDTYGNRGMTMTITNMAAESPSPPTTTAAGTLTMMMGKASINSTGTSSSGITTTTSGGGGGGGNNKLPLLSGRKGSGASTTNDMEGVWPVMVWEDPFSTEEERKDFISSAVSLPSVRRAAVARRDLVNLPYRTLDVDISSSSSSLLGNSTTFGKGIVMHNSSLENKKKKKKKKNVEYTSDGVRIDHWSDGADVAFRPYLEYEEQRRIREAMEKVAMEEDPYYSGDTEEEEEEEEEEENAITNSRHFTDSDGGNRSKESSNNRRLFLVCYHLPVILTRDVDTGTWSACWSESLIAKTEQSGITKTRDVLWLGTVSAVPPIASDEEKEEVRKVLEPMNCIPIFLDEEVSEAHYHGMCKQVLWPAFHNVDLLDLSKSGWGQRELTGGGRSAFASSASSTDPTNVGTDSDWDQSRLDGWWGAYRAVNKVFADVLIGRLRPHDTVWVHDYHLSLLPRLLDEAERSSREDGRRTIKMVYFLHIPFPTSQVFRELFNGEDILEGMLHADVIGFHAFDHARHFLNAAKRILGLSYESLVGGLIGVLFRGKKIVVTISNVSVEPDIVEAALALPSVKEGADALKEKYGKRTIIAGVDVAQRLSGVAFKFRAYERLLIDYPNWRNKVVLVQKCLVPGSRGADEADTLREIRCLVRRLQDRYSSHLIDYEEIIGDSLPIDQRLALWTAAEILMHTPIREGLNLIPLEYVFARKDEAVPGVTIASEFSAVCSVLNGALRVNPFDVLNTAISIDKALAMDLQGKEARRTRDIDFVSSCPSGLWTTNVLRDLNDATIGSYSDDDQGDEAITSDKMETVGDPDALFKRENELAVSRLDIDSVIAAYNITSNRVIILDFNGTLVMKEPPGKYLKREILGTSGHKPPPAVITALSELCTDARNTVYVVSGDSQKNLEDALGHVPGLGLAASNGGCFADPTWEPEAGRSWQTFDLGVDWNAVKKVALPVLSKYTARTNGSFVKLTHSSIGWSYYSCDPEWGSLQASYLVPELEHELRSFDVRFVTLKGVIEVVPRKSNKGLIVKKVLRDCATKNKQTGVDFILCMGDDISDEKMFTSVYSFIAESAAGKAANSVSPPMYAFTVAVGKKATHACRYVEGASDVADVVLSMSGTDLLGGRSMSWEAEDIHAGQLFL